MTNRITSYAGLEWLEFLAAKRLTSEQPPIWTAIQAMTEQPEFFRLDENERRTAAAWDAAFGMNTDH
jgi:hypothetical protein